MTPKNFSKKSPLNICLLAACAVLPGAASAAGGFSFTKIADATTPRPDGGFFFVKNDIAIPALDGSRLVFLAGDSPETYSVWSANINGTGLVKLADLNTPVPGGVGTFTSLNHVGTPLIKDGSVIISGRDSNNALHFTVHDGLYRVSAHGGPLAKIVDYHSTIPGRGEETFQGWGDSSAGGPRSFSVNGGRVAFTGVNFNTSGGAFLTKLDGTDLKPIGVDFDGFRCPNDLGTLFFPVSGFYFPSLSGNRISSWGAGNLGDNQIMVTPDTSNGQDCTHVGSSLFPLPDDPDAPQRTNYSSGYIQTDGDIIVFAAFDSPKTSDNFRGLFAVCADGSSSITGPDWKPNPPPGEPTCGLPTLTSPASSPFSPFTPIVTTETSLPGLGPVINRNSFSFAADHGQALFLAFDESTPVSNEALYLTKLSDGSITRVIGSGDILDGKQVAKLGNPQAGALSGGNFVFTVEFSNLTQGLYAATQGCAADVSASVSVKRSAFRLNRATGRYVQTVIIKNTGTVPINTPVSLVLSGLSDSTPLVNKTGNTTCLAPVNAAYKSVTVPGNALAAGASVTEQLEFTNSGGQPILYTPQIGAASGP